MVTLKIIDYKQYRKKIIITESIENEIELILQIKNHFPELRIRISLEELRIINDIVYQMMEENNQTYFFFEYMDMVISSTLYQSLDVDKLDRQILIENFQICNIQNILNDSQLIDINKQVEEQLSKKEKIIIPIEVRCENGKTKF